MSDRVFVDTNVLVYSRDSSEPVKQAKAAEWMTHLWRSRTGRLSFQVLQEFYVTVTARLKPGLDIDTARSDVRLLLTWKPVLTDHQILEKAWFIQDRYGLSWWDSMIVAAALVSSCQYLLSEDLQDNFELSGLTIINPFAVQPASLGQGS